MSQPGAISVPTPPPTALPHSPSSHPAPPRTQYPQKESLVAQPCLALCDPTDSSLPGSSMHVIF